jgi:hypothetical protein
MDRTVFAVVIVLGFLGGTGVCTKDVTILSITTYQLADLRYMSKLL